VTFFSRFICVPCLAILSAAAHAQPLPGGGELGMDAHQLREAVPALKPVPRPSRLAGGLVGGYAGAAVEVAGVALTPTFFFAEGQLRRVEYLASPGADAASFDALLAWGRAAWGPELASQSPEGAYATWASGDVDAYLQQTLSTPRAQVRLVVRRRIVKDGDQL
jgi:hypothetical protein